MKKMENKLKSFTDHLDEQYGKKGTKARIWCNIWPQMDASSGHHDVL
jgi:hypothetical protein